MGAVRVLACLVLVAFAVQVGRVRSAPAQSSGGGGAGPEGGVEARVREATAALERALQWDGAPSAPRARAREPGPSDWDALEERARHLVGDLQAELRHLQTERATTPRAPTTSGL